MIVFVQIDTTLSIPAQLATIARLLIPAAPVHDPALDDIDTGNPEDAGARVEAHTDEIEAAARAKWVRSDEIEAAARAKWVREQIAELPNPAPAKAPRKRVTVPACFDGAPLIAYLRASGPQTIGQLVAATGGTSDEMRAALDAIGAVKSGKAKGTRYSAPATTDEA